MSFRPVRKIAGIGNVFLGAELVDIAEYDSDPENAPLFLLDDV